MNNHYQFMVNFTMPNNPPEQFYDLIPFQKVVVERYLVEGKLINYASAMDQGKLWAVFNANSEMEVREMIIDFPLTEYMKVEVSLLNQYQTSEFPASNFSLN